VEVSRQRARDEALEVLNAVVENDQASEEVKAEALAEIQTIAKEMSQESNIESILMSKGFAQCLAVINGDSANIVVKNEGRLQSAQLAQINAVVYEQAGIEPINITIVAKN
jgi:stage III sporulation protein AH